MRTSAVIVLVAALALGAAAGSWPTTQKPTTARPTTPAPTTARPTTPAPTTKAPAVTPTPTSSSCSCHHGIGCTDTLNNCAQGKYSNIFPGSQSCSSCSKSSGWFSCLDSPYVFRNRDTCDQPPPRCNCNGPVLCWDSQRQCQSQSGPTHVNSGGNTNCKALNKPIFSCGDEPYVARLNDDCKPVPPGHGCQDPHFAGFDGSEYYFEGIAGKEYNILSDTTLQVNAHFILLNYLKGTYMGRIGLLFGEHSLTFDPHFGVFFNGSLINQGEYELEGGSFMVDTVDSRLRFTFQNEIYHISAVTAIEKHLRDEAYVNLHTSLYGTPVNPHGILGQTARIAIPGADPLPNPFVVEGREDDYLVHDGLLGTQFTFNRFFGEQGPITATGSRLRRDVGAPLMVAAAY